MDVVHTFEKENDNIAVSIDIHHLLNIKYK